MSEPRYIFDDAEGFVIEQYNDCAPFASFLPGIAGLYGRPAWVFYVNRGQAVASFGMRNKDGAFLEFFPADKAYQLTANRGFRTFLKVDDGRQVLKYEPFQRGAGVNVRQRLYIATESVGVEEINSALGIRIRADMTTLPEADVAGLLRRVEVCNISDRPLRLEIVDGLPQVLPYGLNQWLVKFMSRTSEAFISTEGVSDNAPYYRLKVWPTDSPQVEAINAGHFFAGFLNGQRNQVVVDAERIFGLAGDFTRAEAFFANAPADYQQQILGNQNPAAFQNLSMQLAAGQSRVFYGVYGHADSPEQHQAFLAECSHPDYFEAKRRQNRELLQSSGQRAFTATAQPLFDGHIRQCFLDNGLRGGFSIPVPGGQRLYLFGRKHGDLERDYNDFLLQDTPFSEGNGDFRDMLQNRRMDIFLDPALDDRNIRYFFNLIQPDGNNPCLLRNSRFWLADAQAFLAHFPKVPGLQALLAGEFKYAELWQLLHKADADDDLLTEILTQAEEIEDAEFDRGYWSDHWTYLLDLLNSYAAIFPDRLTDLLLDKCYSFFDPTHYVVPRSQKYQATATGLRQFGAVQFDPAKKELIEARDRQRYRVRSQHGHGDIVYTSLLGKILTLVCNKLANLDYFGVGIEMEADRPGWCDALNGLPGVFGSAINETIELKRLADFCLTALTEQQGDCPLPQELTEFLLKLDELLQSPELTAERFWREAGSLKENYRSQVFMGFAGPEQNLSLSRVCEFLARASRHLDTAIAKAKTPNGIVSFFAHQAVQDGAEISFRQKPLPLFLEGFVHAMRVADHDEARRLYVAVQNSQLFDRKLGMYRLNEPLGDDALALGRIGVFHYGWLENGSIFMHMHYKFVLEMVRCGLISEFYRHMPQLLVAFHDPERYKRNPLETSSFVVCSDFSVDPRQHGRGCVARLSGSTVEMLHLWLHLFLGPQPFVLDNSELAFRPRPLLAETLFTEDERHAEVFGERENLPANSTACALLGNCLLVYLNPERRDCFGPNAVKPSRFELYGRDGSRQSVSASQLSGQAAHALRQGQIRRLEVLLA